jgi:hypothetical protein
MSTHKNTITDYLHSEEFPAKSWSFCGKFPLDKITPDQRACRADWRAGANIPEIPDLVQMFSISVIDNKLVLIREHLDSIDEIEPFNNLEDMLAEDWYLEIEE